MKDEYINGTRIKCYAQPENTSCPTNWDRFTVVYPHMKYNPSGTLVWCVGLSGHSGTVVGRHLGKRVPFATLPASLRRTVEMDCGAVAALETMEK